ncbi:MAG: Na+/H+ antiporter subunit E [Wolbachia endosymbiont of Menacanthus eurysternus]|nr:MAG: Na+/H+ antiporter subunit E [Wolbachia endosymbiont of Menacanthus eurysternus]
MVQNKQKNYFFFITFVTLFFLWITLSGYFKLFFIFCGIFSSIFVLFIFKRLINNENTLNQILNTTTNKLLLYKLLINYTPWLIYQIIFSNIYIAKKILQIKLKLEPIIIVKKCKKHNDKSITLFANSITITPGTLTIDIIKKRKTYLSTIYLIDKSLKKSIFITEKKVLELGQFK